MRTVSSHITSRILAVILALSAFVSLCACSALTGKKEETTDSIKDINEYIKDLTEVNIGDYFAEAEMNSKKSSSEETAKIRIRLNENTVEKVREILDMHTARGSDTIPGYQDHPYALEMKKMSVTDHYIRVVSGKNVKSRPVNFYIAEYGGEYYVFIFS
ncbi:MAG: hypothetical protein IKH23_08455 [Clostridiales bacterium]|nr:hypothetical protein [Clostridiales bacterium]